MAIDQGDTKHTVTVDEVTAAAEHADRVVNAWVPVVVKVGALGLGLVIIYAVAQAMLGNEASLFLDILGVVHTAVVVVLVGLGLVVVHDIRQGEGPDWTLLVLHYMRTTITMVGQQGGSSAAASRVVLPDDEIDV